MGNNYIRPIVFRQSLADFPCPVALGRKMPSFGLHRYKQGLRFVPPDDEGFTLRGDKRRLLYKGRRRSHRFTILGNTSFEYDCILEREPDTNVITLLIEGAEHYDFFKQPDFVKDPFLKGSYAVYKKNTLIGEGTGKLCHIHRPLIIDALGRRVWGELAVVGNELRITIPEQWLAIAKYPVVVDPVVGTTTIGAHSGYYEDYQEDYIDEDGCLVEHDNFYLPFLCESTIAVNRYQIPQDMLGKATAYVYLFMHQPVIRFPDKYNENFDIRPCLYSDNNNKPSQRLSSNEVFFDHVVNTTTKPDGWRTATFFTNQIINMGSYIWFGIHSGCFQPRFDYGGKCYICWDNYWDYDLPPPDIYPIDWDFYQEEYIGSRDIILSMYFYYTPMQHYIRTLTQGVKMNDSPKLTADYSKAIKLTVNGNTVLGGFNTFVRQCIANVTNSAIVDKSVGNIRTIIQQIYIFSDFMNVRELMSKIIETVQAGDFIQRIQELWRELQNTAAVGDTVMSPIVFVRSIGEETNLNDTYQHLGDYIRGLADNADNTAETYHKGDYYRTESETAHVEGIAIKGLLLFIRIVSQVFFRDYLLGRFLIAREELKLKSYITRVIVFDSKID
jgi:hypothetical protein